MVTPNDTAARARAQTKPFFTVLTATPTVGCRAIGAT
jgi:hypothetical protein